jgi:hypothetical protein
MNVTALNQRINPAVKKLSIVYSAGHPFASLASSRRISPGIGKRTEKRRRKKSREACVHPSSHCRWSHPNFKLFFFLFFFSPVFLLFHRNANERSSCSLRVHFPSLLDRLLLSGSPFSPDTSIIALRVKQRTEQKSSDAFQQ